jgi:hypothetical protein
LARLVNVVFLLNYFQKTLENVIFITHCVESVCRIPAITAQKSVVVSISFKTKELPYVNYRSNAH